MDFFTIIGVIKTMDYDDYLLNVKHLTDVEKAERILQGHCDECFAYPGGWEHFDHCSKQLTIAPGYCYAPYIPV